MSLASHRLAAVFAVACAAGLGAQQQAGDLPTMRDHRVRLQYASFDPTIAQPSVPGTLRGAGDVELWIVQFFGNPTEEGRLAIQATGARIYSYLPDNAYLVRMSAGTAAAVNSQPAIRWVGHYQPAFRLEPALLKEHLAGGEVPERRYNILMVDKHRDKAALAANILAIGGVIVDRHDGSPLFTVDLDGVELLAAARLDEVLWIDRWTPAEEDMNNARIQGGGNYVEAAGGYTGSGINGHVYEGVEAAHSDFTIAMTNVRSGGGADDHGHCTAGIVFGNGTSHPNARGMAPAARGFYTQFSTVTAGWSRNAVLGEVVNVHQGMFTTASWGNTTTTAYTSVSADTDDIIFDHRIPWTQSQSNTGNQFSRPQAWAKNIFSIGAVQHFDNSNPADDSWSAGNASTGLAADGRIKPDLCAYYDSIWTSDRTGGAGYTNLNYNTNFGGTSGATPIVAGHNALAIQMFTNFIFGNTPRVPGGTRFQNRPFAQTLKALQIVSARQYTFNAASVNNLRRHQGWGFPNLQTMYDRRAQTYIVPEDDVVTQGTTRTHNIQVVAGSELKICMTFVDPAGNPAAAQDRINDLTLRVTAPNGVVYWGNNGLTTGMYSSSGGVANTIDTVECVFIQSPLAGIWRVEVIATQIVMDAHVATAATDATYALAVCGGTEVIGSGCGKFIPDADPSAGTCNVIPFGTQSRFNLTTVFAQNNSGSAGGAVYFDITAANDIIVNGISVNASGPGTPVGLQVYRTNVGGTHVGNEATPALWTLVASGAGLSAGPDVPTQIDLTPFALSSGTYGIALVAGGFMHHYTNGANVYSDANVTLNTGSATNVPFTGSPFTPRTANLDLRYRLVGGSWTNQRYQTILRRADLGPAGQITGLAFAPCGTGTHWNDGLTIRMSHVAAGYTLLTTFAANLPSPVTVMQVQNHHWPVTADNWHEVGLTSAFNYNGTSDVVVDILATGNDFDGTVGFHRATEPRVYAVGWTGSPPATGSSGDAAAKMRVQFGCADIHKYGTSCGTLQIGSSGLPVLGRAFRVTASGGTPGSLALLVLGFNNTAPVYPVSLTPAGIYNCLLWHDVVITTGQLMNATGSAAVTYAFPFNPNYVGTKFNLSWVELGLQLSDWSVSDYLRVLNGVTP